MLNEYKRKYLREFYREYRKKNKEKIKEIAARWINKNRVNQRQQSKKWYISNREKEIADKKLYFKKVKQKNPSYHSIILATQRIKKSLEWNKMHTSKKLMITLKQLLDSESSTLTSSLDIRHWNQIKPRLEACIILAEKWKEEFDILYNNPK